jgi:WD40 repeat protein
MPARAVTDRPWPGRFPRIRWPRGLWLWLTAALVVAVAGTVTGLAVSSDVTSPGQGSWPASAEFSTDGRYLVTAGLRDAQVIDAASGRVLAEWQPASAADADLDGVGISKDDNTVVTVSVGYVQRWSIAGVLAAGVGGNPRPLSVFQAEPRAGGDPIFAAQDVLSPDGVLLAVNDLLGHVVVWNTLTRRVVGTIAVDGLGTVGWSPDSQVLVSTSPRDDFQLWNFSAGRARLAGTDAGADDIDGYVYLYPFVFTAQDGLVITQQSGAVTRLLDAATRKQLAIAPLVSMYPGKGPHSDDLTTYSAASGLVAEADVPHQGWVTVWSAASGRVVARLAPPQVVADQMNAHFGAGGIRCNVRLAFSPDGKTLAILPGQTPAWLTHVPGPDS